MSLKNCVVTFDSRSNGVFFSGENVTGTISLTMDKTKAIEALAVKIIGKSCVKWSESRGSGRARKSVMCLGKVVHVKQHIELLRKEASAKSMDLKKGKHEFNFEVQLPSDLPSSYQGEFGKVRYTVKVLVERNKKKKLKFKMPFTVLSNVDLNFYPGFRMPILKDISKDFSFIFSKERPLNLNFELPASAFVPGEIIPIKCTASNDNKTIISGFKYTLIRMTSFRAALPDIKIRSEEIKIAECEGEGFSTGETNLSKSLMPVPPIPPSTLIADSIIKIEYIFKIKVKVSGFHSDLKLSFPVIIGTMPFLSGSEQPSTSHLEITSPPDSGPPLYHEVMEDSDEIKSRYPLFQTG